MIITIKCRTCGSAGNGELLFDDGFAVGELLIRLPEGWHGTANHRPGETAVSVFLTCPTCTATHDAPRARVFTCILCGCHEFETVGDVGQCKGHGCSFKWPRRLDFKFIRMPGEPSRRRGRTATQ
jgi:hypothetical protein